jgi:tyrosine-protein kinase Etk/Wzc
MLGIEGANKQVQVVTSAVPGDGKTTFTVNFAITLAIAGHRVLIVDADMRRGNIHSFFKMEREGGLAEILSGESHWTDVLRDTPVPSLKLIATGKMPNNPGELLMGPVTRQLIEEVRGQFEYIIFDCPPLTAIDDTFALINLSDGVLFVVRAGQTSMRFARNATAAVQQRGSRVYGVVLNGITTDNPYYYYNHYYHSYYKGKQPSGPLSSDARPGLKMAAPKERAKTVPPA